MQPRETIDRKPLPPGQPDHWVTTSNAIMDSIETRAQEMVLKHLSLESMEPHLGILCKSDTEPHITKIEGMGISTMTPSPRPQKITTKGREVHAIWIGMDIIVKWEESYRIAGSSEPVTMIDPVVRKCVFGIDKTILQGTTKNAHGIAIDGLVSAGSGDLSSPSILDAGSTAGGWNDVGNARQDIAKLKSTLMKHNIPCPYACLIPPHLASREIIKWIKKSFDEVILTPTDGDGNDIVTGKDENTNDFQVHAVSLPFLHVVSLTGMKPLTLQSLRWDNDKREGIIRFDGKIGWYADSRETSPGVFQKGVCKIDSISL